MHATTAVPHGLDGTSEPDCAALVDRPGPFVSVYLQTDPAAEPAPHTADVHWRDLRRALAGVGAHEDALAAIDPLVADAHRFGVALAVVAEPGRLDLVDHFDEALVHDLGRVGALPSLGAVLEWRERHPNFVVALCDRAGADLVAVRRGAEVARESAGDPERHDPLLHKVRSGGWSTMRYQHRVEQHWEQDARAVAEALAALAEEVAARLVLVGGDLRAVELVRASLPEGLRAPVETISGSRAADGSADATSEEIRRAVASAVAEDHASALAAHRDRLSSGLACAGAPDTLAALAEGRVELLLVNDDPSDERQAAFSRRPFSCATEPALLAGLGGEIGEARLVDVAIAAAFSSGASVRIVPRAPHLEGGIGALLRFSGDNTS